MRQLKVEVCREITLKCYVHTKYRQTVHGSTSRNSNCQSRKYVWWLQHVVFIAVNSYYLFGCARTKWGKMFTESTQVSAKIWSHKWKWKWMWECVSVFYFTWDECVHLWFREIRAKRTDEEEAATKKFAPFPFSAPAQCVFMVKNAVYRVQCSLNHRNNPYPHTFKYIYSFCDRKKRNRRQKVGVNEWFGPRATQS